MDSMINRYTSDRKIRSEDAYTAHGEPNKRPDRAVTVYAQRAREAYPESAIVIGSIEASLRRIAHYDYWSDKVRRSVLPPRTGARRIRPALIRRAGSIRILILMK